MAEEEVEAGACSVDQVTEVPVARDIEIAHVHERGRQGLASQVADPELKALLSKLALDDPRLSARPKT